jgi:organic hydroperoxide reductase OsmC/OhrA
MEGQAFEVTLDLKTGYEFQVDFHEASIPPLAVDEAPPLGEGRGPNPARLLATAVANCLAASLLFCLRRSRIDVRGLRATVRGTLVRNERGRLRIGGLDVTIQPDVAAEDRDRMGRCHELFEDFCIVTESVRHGVDVQVHVDPVAR